MEKSKSHSGALPRTHESPSSSRSPAAKANPKNPARCPPLKPKNEHAKTPHTVRPPVPHPPLADGSNAFGHAVHRRDHGRFASKLSYPRGNPSAAGHHDPDSGHHPVCEPRLHEAAAVSAHYVPPGKVPGFVIREVALRPDVRPAARGLGHVVRRPLSHRDVWASASAANSSDQPDPLRGLAPVTYDPRVSAVRYDPRAPQRGAVPHTDRS
jgi:hypothetical protein